MCDLVSGVIGFGSGGVPTMVSGTLSFVNTVSMSTPAPDSVGRDATGKVFGCLGRLKMPTDTTSVATQTSRRN